MSKTQLTLSPLLCDGMVLQREVDNDICGRDWEALIVTVFFLDQVFSAPVDENHEFCITLPSVKAGGPYTLRVVGSSEIIIHDILFGDVYLLAGQSNMELPIRRVLDVSGKEIEGSVSSRIRQYKVPASYEFHEPLKYVQEGKWTKAVGEDLMEFSAAGYFFAKELEAAYDIPIGLILTAVGGSTIEAWMNPIRLQEFGDYQKEITNFKDIGYFQKFLKEQESKVIAWMRIIEEEEVKFTPFEKYREWDCCMVPSLVADYTDQEFHGSVYLCKEVYLEEEPKEDALLYMGSIIDGDRIWINHIEVGSTAYRYPPRKYKINPGILKKGSNLITVYIMINNKNGGTIKGKPYYLRYNEHRINLAGEWYYRIGYRAPKPMPSVLFPPTLPSCFYNTVIVPLAKVQIKGIVWYQGEANTANPIRYGDKFMTMVRDWRSLFGWEVPVLFAQLPNYQEPLDPRRDSGWAELRDEQRKCLALDQVAMVTTLDIGEENDLHPQNKKEVGVRFAKAARNIIYGEAVIYSGPIPLKVRVKKKKEEKNETEGIEEKDKKEGIAYQVVLEFLFLEEAEGETSLKHFELAGEDGLFHEASAIRKGKYVHVSCKEIDKAKQVRYAWCDNPEGINFYNNEGLPAAGFVLDIDGDI